MMGRAIAFVGLAASVTWPGARPARQRSAPLPRFVMLRLAGIDLLHAGEQGVVRRLGRAVISQTDGGRALRYRDTGQGVTLEFVVDDESGAIRSARAAADGPGGPALESRLPRPLTGNGLSLGDPAAAVERALGKPHRKVDGRDQGSEWVYRQAMRADGSLPAYEGRWRFTRGRLVALHIRIGE